MWSQDVTYRIDGDTVRVLAIGSGDVAPRSFYQS